MREMVNTTQCWHQLFKPETPFCEVGVGNCGECLPDPSNRSCKRYDPIVVRRPPITFHTFEAIGVCPYCKKVMSNGHNVPKDV